jgi:LytS/YehU family sensor histidine kinase
MILDFSDNAFVDLEDEIKFIQLYLSLEAMRMGNDFSYEVKASQKILDDDIGVPSLLIQPFIENAIWHGLINKDGDKKLTVSFEQGNDVHRLTCTVEDNGIGREKAAETKRNNHTMLHESKGIRITQERIELLQYQIKNEVSVTISDKVDANNQSSGTLVKLILPVNG